MKNLPINLKIGIAILATILICSMFSRVWHSSIEVFNTTTELQAEHSAVVQKQVTNYDGYYQTFVDKSENANINKEAFIEVTNIIMSNRADGENLSWKWVRENQHIPYEEFTVFYKELSAFIGVRYQDNMIIEQEKQNIVKRHNLMLSKFPGNVYNKMLKIDPLEYKMGYVSDSTLNRFK